MPSAVENADSLRALFAHLGLREAAASVALDKDADGRDVTVAWNCKTCVRDCSARDTMQGCSEWMPEMEVPS